MSSTERHVRRHARQVALALWVGTNGWPTGATVRTLAGALGCDRRTVYRDLRAVALAIPLVERMRRAAETVQP